MSEISFACPDLSRSPEVIEQLCRVAESQVEGLAINCTYGADRPVKLSERATFISTRLASYQPTGVEPFSLSLCNDDPDQGFSSLTIWLPYPRLADRTHTLVSVVLPDTTPVGAMCGALQGIGDAATAWHGTAQLFGGWPCRPSRSSSLPCL